MASFLLILSAFPQSIPHTEFRDFILKHSLDHITLLWKSRGVCHHIQSTGGSAPHHPHPLTSALCFPSHSQRVSHSGSFPFLRHTLPGTFASAWNTLTLICRLFWSFRSQHTHQLPRGWVSKAALSPHQHLCLQGFLPLFASNPVLFFLSSHCLCF